MALPKKIDELRSALLQAGVSEDVVTKSSKRELESLYEQTVKNFDITFEAPVAQETVEVSTMAATLPAYGSDDWQDYVLSLLKPSEQLEGHPRCFGLRRIAQMLLGPIVSSKASTVSVIPVGESRAVTINYEITIDWKLDRSIFLGGQDTGLYRVFGGVADCVEDIKTPYGKHPAASAETKAMSRALKQALCLNVLSAEEKVSGYDDKEESTRSNSSKITEMMVKFIEAKVKSLKIDTAKMAADTKIDLTDLTNLTVEQGKVLFNYINDSQQKR